jgi:predicted AlkP superfamily pyrophosphatase or phosphodiesterase
MKQSASRGVATSHCFWDGKFEMSSAVVFLSIPGLRAVDLSVMPNLSRLMAAGEQSELVASFPAVTWPVQANMLTGKLPSDHGVIANGFYWREQQQVEMWTAGNEKINAPQIWDMLHESEPNYSSAVWFPMLSKGCGADFICMPAPVHNPDGSESLWCYTKPIELYGELLEQLDHFPLKNFWGPLASIASTAWIADSAVVAARRYRPSFFHLYLPQLDYAAQQAGPDSEAARQAVIELDEVLGELVAGFEQAYESQELTWIAVSEYVITQVDHVSYPNRILREAGLLKVTSTDEGEQLDLQKSDAWALVDHQFSHVFIRDANLQLCERVRSCFENSAGIAEVLVGDERRKYAMDHERSGEVILVSEADSWQAYYWWLDDALAPGYATTVDIHRKPGYDPVELFWDPVSKGVPLDATRVKGSHGAPVLAAEQVGVALSSRENVLGHEQLRDIDMAQLVLNCFKVE